MIRLSPGLAMNHRFQFNPKNPTLLLTQIDPRRRSLSRIKPRSGGDGVVFRFRGLRIRAFASRRGGDRRYGGDGGDGEERARIGYRN
ncbi:unnamed protein product [Cochlearia groenlandica]